MQSYQATETKEIRVMATVDTTASAAPLLTPNLEDSAALVVVVGLMAPGDEDEGAVDEGRVLVLSAQSRGSLEPTTASQGGKDTHEACGSVKVAGVLGEPVTAVALEVAEPATELDGPADTADESGTVASQTETTA